MLLSTNVPSSYSSNDSATTGEETEKDDVKIDAPPIHQSSSSPHIPRSEGTTAPSPADSRATIVQSRRRPHDGTHHIEEYFKVKSQCLNNSDKQKTKPIMSFLQAFFRMWRNWTTVAGGDFRLTSCCSCIPCSKSKKDNTANSPVILR